MRSVTRKPPTTLMAPKPTAIAPSTFASVLAPSAPATMIAPTMTMPWMAFVPLISGVCSIAGTFEITS